MDGKYQNKYRTAPARLNGWDYGSHGLYFITICTKDRVSYFGEIVQETQSIVSLQETAIAKVAINNWHQISQYFPFVTLDEFILMPDHLHGILFFDKPDKNNWQPNAFGPQSQNLASIIRGYKASVKTYATINQIDFAWQSRYYDRIIRNEQEYLNIRQYIYNNPENWLKGDHGQDDYLSL